MEMNATPTVMGHALNPNHTAPESFERVLGPVFYKLGAPEVLGALLVIG
jgi:hypothetical protein